MALAMTGIAGGLNSKPARNAAELGLRLAHVARMEGRADLERNVRADAGGLELGLHFVDGGDGPGNDRLIERVVIGDVEPCGPASLLQHGFDSGRLEPDDRGHAAAAHLPHHRAAALDERAHRSRNQMKPAASSALYSPRLWPATKSGGAAPSSMRAR